MQELGCPPTLCRNWGAPHKPSPMVDPTTRSPMVHPTTHSPTVHPTTHSPMVDPTTHSPMVHPTTHSPMVDRAALSYGGPHNCQHTTKSCSAFPHPPSLAMYRPPPLTLPSLSITPPGHM